MSRKKIDTKFLVFKPNVFVEKQLIKAKRRHSIAKAIYVSFNITSFVSTFILLALSTVIFSKIISKSTPDWYFIVTTGIAASVTLITSMSNFFYVKEQMDKYSLELEYIEAEITYFELNLKDYDDKKTKEFKLFHNVSSFIGNRAAKEAENE